MPRSSGTELLDDHAYHDLNELRANLRDMARYDRWMGMFDDVLRAAHLQTARTALDVGVGSGEFIALAQARAPQVRWVAFDLSRDVLRIAREHTHAPQVQGRAQHLPFADGSFDVVTCANTLHHLGERDAMLLVQECARVGRRVVIADLARNRCMLTGAWLLTRLTSSNRLTRADGVQSVRRAFTAEEALALAQKSGLHTIVVEKRLLFRYVMVWDG